MALNTLPPWSRWHRVALAIADDGIGTIPRLMPRMVCAAMAELVEAGLVEKRGRDLFVVSKAGADLRMAGLVERVRPAGDLYRLTAAARRLRQAHIDRCASEYEASGTADAERRDATSARTWWTEAKRAYELAQAQQRSLAEIYEQMDRANQDWAVQVQGPGMAGPLRRVSALVLR